MEIIMPQYPTKKLGRLPRKFSPKIPHFSALLQSVPTLPPLPANVDNTGGQTEWSVMLNDSLGDCTCAAFYHARQIWSKACSNEDTQPDSSVLALYEATCGYIPGDPSTDNGGAEQDVLAYLHSTGAPLANGTRDKILAFIEVDQRNMEDVHRTIYECGLAYIGFNVPSSVMPPNGETPKVWDVVKGETDPIGGHAIILTGYKENGNMGLISWGENYEMTPAFFSAFVDEVYAIASLDWVKATGNTPLGMTLDELASQMRYFAL